MQRVWDSDLMFLLLISQYHITWSINLFETFWLKNTHQKPKKPKIKITTQRSYFHMMRKPQTFSDKGTITKAMNLKEKHWVWNSV